MNQFDKHTAAIREIARSCHNEDEFSQKMNELYKKYPQDEELIQNTMILLGVSGMLFNQPRR